MARLLTTSILVILTISSIHDVGVNCQRRGSSKSGSVIVINNHGGSRGGCPAGGGESSGSTTMVKTSKKGHTIIIKGPGSKKSKKAEEHENVLVPVPVPIGHGPGHGYTGHETKMAPVFVPSDEPLSRVLMMNPVYPVNNPVNQAIHSAVNQHLQMAVQQINQQQMQSNRGAAGSGHGHWTPAASYNEPVHVHPSNNQHVLDNNQQQIQNRNLDVSQIAAASTGNVATHSHPFQGMFPRQQTSNDQEKDEKDDKGQKEQSGHDQQQQINQQQQQFNQMQQQQQQFVQPHYPQFLPPNFLPPFPGFPMAIGQMPMAPGFPMNGMTMNGMATDNIEMNRMPMHPMHYQPQPSGPQLQIPIEPQANLHPVFEPDTDKYDFQDPLGFESSQSWPVMNQQQQEQQLGWLGQLLWKKKK